MIYFGYLICAVVIVWLSNKASIYVDLLDKKTSLSGAFIGGVMLSAVTSLPELFTSLSSTVWLNEPGLCLGNILGSNLFNLLTIAVMILIFYKGFSSAKISKSHITVAVTVIGIYLFMMINLQDKIPLEIATVNVISVIIIALYIFGVKNMAGDESQTDESCQYSNLTVKQISIRFILVSIGIIAVSIVITKVTDIIADENHLNLGAGLAGALFLGIATSLPELSSTFSLFRLKNYNIAIGNIIGSNLFNFTILSIADVFYIKSGGKGAINGRIFDFISNSADPKNINLLVFGTIAMFSMLILFKFKNKFTQMICPLTVIGCYIAFLAV
ncbi:MAG: cation transporter [Clostridia bacterium]|nr:cation transporter [Clostridia bacterium]